MKTVICRHFLLYSNLDMLLSLFFFVLSFLTLSCHAGTNEEGLKFLEENKNKPGVISLPSGLQYKVLNPGKGTRHPTADSSCSCHYEGKLIDGTIFDSSYQRGSPTSFAPNQVIKGWTEAMQLMVAGDKWEMYIPSELGYGDSGSPPKIGGGDVLVFQMEILGILGDSVPALTCKLNESGCNEKEIKYIAKINAFEPSKVESEIERINKLLGKSMSDDLRNWAHRRRHLLLQVGKSDSEEEAEL
jgi:FKBP-type peptidyl-prolyl cis-trans isomerase FklB